MADCDIDIDELLGGCDTQHPVAGEVPAPVTAPEDSGSSAEDEQVPEDISPADALVVALDHLLDTAGQLEAALLDLRAAASRARAYASEVGEVDDDDR